MAPATVNFPPQIKKVGIVNNVSALPDNRMEATDSVKKPMFEIVRKVTNYNGDPALATQSLAEIIAEQNYFDLVLIQDSALRANDFHPRESMLSQEEVMELTEDMDVDMLISLENLQIKITKKINGAPDRGYWSITEAKISPLLRLYIPQRAVPLVEVNAADTIFWEDESFSEARLMSSLLPDEEIVKEASLYAGNIPIKHIIPYWKTNDRYLYTGGDSQMRNATYLAQNNQWKEAGSIWKEIYEKKKSPKQKMYAAFNTALYYELEDNFEEALNWARKALEIAKERTEYREVIYNNQYAVVTCKQLCEFYTIELEKRNKDAAKVNMQLERFNEEF